MRTAYPRSERIFAPRNANVAGVGQILRLLGAGATGEILLALGEGPMQTKVLTHRVRGYTPRTIYRYLSRLAELGVLEREDELGGRPRVVHTLNPESGRELCKAIERFADTSLSRLPNGQLGGGSWASLGMLADLWEAGVVAELSRGARSPTELARGLEAMSYHQINRRASRFNASGFLCEEQRADRQRRRYALTDRARRTMGLIADIGRWRQRRLELAGREGLTVGEMATVLRASLPLVRVPQYVGRAFEISVAAEVEGMDSESESIWFEIDSDGLAQLHHVPPTQLDAWAEADVGSWMETVLDGEPPLGGGTGRDALADCLTNLHARLWTPSPF